MGVKLRKIKNTDGSTSLMLDIWHDGKRQREYLTQLKLIKPITALDRRENKERLQLAEQIKNKKEQQLQADDYDITPEFKKGIDFLKYFESYLNKYNKKDKRVMVSCYNKFKAFVIDEQIKELTTKKISESVIINFKEYLEHHLNGESPANYFKKFKKVLSNGVKDKVFRPEIAALLASKDKSLSVQRNDSIKKDILTFEEIQAMAKTQAGNNEVKRAFLFCCLTGLRFCDVKVLTWKNIQKGVLKLKQQKTQIDVTINLNQSALNLLGEKGKQSEEVFTLPSHNGCLKILRTWTKRAEIDKHITWHCARHSFATGIIFHGSDVKTASTLLGHSSLTYTDRYLRESNKLKENATNRLPEVIINNI
jgi:integrase/recombinase XerD